MERADGRRSSHRNRTERLGGFIERGRVVQRDEHGAPVRMLGIQRDVNAAHEAEEERVRLSTRMEQNQRLESTYRLTAQQGHHNGHRHILFLEHPDSRLPIQIRYGCNNPVHEPNVH